MSGRSSRYRDDEIPTLYVRQVHYSARPDDLRALFERMGPVRDVYIPLDYYTRESRGFAYVKFEFTRDAEDALRKLNGASILGRRIEVEWAEGQRKSKTLSFSAKTEMRARDSYSSYRVRNRYRSRSPRRSGRERSPRRRSRSRRRSHSRTKRRSHNSRHRSRSRHHYSSGRSRNSRSTRSSSTSVPKNRDEGRKIESSKSPLASGSLRRELDEIKNTSDDEQDIGINQHNISNRQTAEELKEPIIDELEVRSEARASDIEVDERQVQKAIQENGSAVYLEEHFGVDNDGSNTSATEEEEEDKAVMDIEVIDEILEQNGIHFNDTVVDGDCLDDNINVPELLVTKNTS